MLNIDRVRGVMRAKYGSQIPKFLKPAGSLPEIDPINKGSRIAIPKAPDSLTRITNSAAELQKLKEFADYINKNKGNVSEGFRDEWMRRKAHKAIYGENYKTSKFRDTVDNFAYDVKNAAIEGLSNISLANIESLVSGADTLLSNKVDINSSGYTFTKNALNSISPYLGLATEAINAGFSSTLPSFSIDENIASEIGGGYGGSMADINKALSLEGLTVGFFTSKSDKEDAILHGQDVWEKLVGINSTNRDLKARVNDAFRMNVLSQNNGGFDFRMSAKKGGTLDLKINLIKSRKFNLVINVDTKLIEEFKEGGKIQAEWEPIIEDLWEPVIDIFQKGGKTRTLEELIEYAKKENPRFIQRLSESPKGINFVDEEGKNAQGSHLLGYELDKEGNAIVFPSIQEMEDGNLKYLSLWDAYDRAIEKKNFLKMTPEEAKLFTESGEDELGNLFGYKKGWPEFFKKFKKGGILEEELETPEIEETNQKNLIPEGALHKNKHHIEHTDGLTQKGIPVVDNDGEQLAEIELDEIIFTLEVTKKLEELYKDGSDKAAIEAGKLLVKEILFNTEDRTGLISKCEKGGKL